MQDFASSFQNALRLILTGDPDLLEIVLLSLWVSIGADLIAALIALPLGAALALARFRGRGAVITVTHDIGQARRLGQDLVFMARGQVMEQGAMEPCFAAPETVELRDFLAAKLTI